MADLSTEFCGIAIKNPIEVASCNFRGLQALGGLCSLCLEVNDLC